jgi:glutamine cyclotransferase
MRFLFARSFKARPSQPQHGQQVKAHARIPTLSKSAHTAPAFWERARLGRSQRRPRRWHSTRAAKLNGAGYLDASGFGARAHRTATGAVALPSSSLPLLSSILILLAACSLASAQTTPAKPAAATNNATPLYHYEIVHTYPHDRAAFTQGLVFLDGVLYESTGLNGASTLRKVELETGKVLKKISIPGQYFGEGIAILDGKIFHLTWQNQKGFVYDLQTFNQEKEFSYTGEGWGLATDGHSLIMSDGTDQIRFLDPRTLQVEHTIRVSRRGQPVVNLNELEYIKGEIFANIWETDYVVRIDPKTGQVVGIINFTGLLPPEDRNGTDVLNGIAYDAAGDRLFITGKCWPKLFEVRLKPAP